MQRGADPSRSDVEAQEGSTFVNAIIYLVGLIVIVMAVLSLAGLH